MSAPGEAVSPGLESTASSALRSSEKLQCYFCKKFRHRSRITFSFFDIGKQFGVREGIVGVNLPHCVDEVKCVEGAAEWKEQR